MAKFIDKTGQEWSLEVGAEMLPELRALGLDLGKPATVLDQLEAVVADPFASGAVLWVLCREQAEGRGLSPDAFARCFNGQALGEAEVCLFEAVTVFTHRRFPTAGAAAVRKYRATMASLGQGIADRIEAIPIPSGSTASAGSSPGLSESPPAAGRSAG